MPVAIYPRVRSGKRSLDRCPAVEDAAGDQDATVRIGQDPGKVITRERSVAIGLAAAAASVAAVTVAIYGLRELMPVVSTGVVYLLAVLLVSTYLAVVRRGFDALVIPAATEYSDGFAPGDVAWVLETAPGEVLVVRPPDSRERGE